MEASCTDDDDPRNRSQSPKTASNGSSVLTCLLPSNVYNFQGLLEEMRGAECSHTHHPQQERMREQMLLITHLSLTDGPQHSLGNPQAGPSSHTGCEMTPGCHPRRLSVEVRLLCLNINSLLFPCLVFCVSIIWQSWVQLRRRQLCLGERLSSSYWARELSSLLSTSVAAWLKTQRDACLFSSTNIFSPKPRNDSVVKDLLQTGESPGLFIPLLLPQDPKTHCLQIPTMSHGPAHLSLNLYNQFPPQGWRCGRPKIRFIHVSKQELHPNISPKVMFCHYIMLRAYYKVLLVLSRTEPEHCQKASFYLCFLNPFVKTLPHVMEKPQEEPESGRREVDSRVNQTRTHLC